LLLLLPWVVVLLILTLLQLPVLLLSAGGPS
jgi:hypothetical protein